jgi:hypothetical protein
MATIESILVDGQDPSMPALRAWLANLSGSVAAAAGGFRTFASLAALNAYTPAAGEPTYAFVTDPKLAAYKFTGALPWVADPTFYEGVATVVQPLVDDAEDARDQAIQARDGIAITATGNGFPNSVRKAEALNGAVLTYDRYGAIGAIIPKGVTGRNTTVRPGVAIDGSRYAGRTARITFVPKTSATFTRGIDFGGVLAVRAIDGSESGRAFSNRMSTAVGNSLAWSVDFVVSATDERVFTFATLSSATATDVEERFEIDRASIQILTGLSPIEANVNSQIAEAIANAAVTGDSELIRTITVSPTNGAARLLSALGDPIGITIAPGELPPGQHSGYSSVIQTRFPVDKAMAGSLEEFWIVADLSASFTRGTILPTFLVDKDGGGASPSAQVNEFVRLGSKLYWRIVYRLAADDISVAPFIQLAGSTDNVTGSTPETVAISFTSRRYLSSTNPLRNVAEVNRDRFRARVMSQAAEIAVKGVPQTNVVVGTGSTYTNIQTASDTVPNPSASMPYNLRLGAQVYGGLSGFWLTRDYVNVTGIGTRSHIHYDNPNDAARQTLLQSYAVTLVSTTRIEGVRLTAKNARYVAHVDDNNGASKDSMPSFINSRLEHLGNYEAANYQIGDRSVAIGGGISSGQVVSIIATVAIGPDGGGLSVHNNADSLKPSHFICEDSRDVAHVANRYASTQSLGSGQADLATYRNNVFPGGRYICSVNWQSANPLNQPANRCEFTVVGSGNSPVAFYVTDPGRAFRVRSASTAAGSKVEVVAGGSAVVPLFGSEAIVKRGGAGLAAAVYGADDRSGGTYAGYQTLSLGRALGDCSTTPKSIGFRFQGGATVTVTFITNLTNASNDAVLEIINARLGINGTADLWAIGNETVRGQLGGELSPRNATATAILRKTALAWNGSKTSVRPMTSADPISLFAGVAYEDILAGEAGRVKTGGYIALADLWYIESELSRYDYIGDSNFDKDAKRLAFGDSFGIDPTTPGRLTKNNGGLLPMVVPADVENNFSTAHEVRMLA